MKKIVNLSLDHKVVNLLGSLTERYALSKTRIVEEAIECFAEKKSQEKVSIMSFAGSIKGEEIDKMLKAIKENKINKGVVRL